MLRDFYKYNKDAYRKTFKRTISLYIYALQGQQRKVIVAFSISVLPLSILILSIPSYHCTKSPQFLY